MRIVSLCPSLTELVFDLGRGDGDGLELYAGPVPDTNLYGDTWVPGEGETEPW